MLQQRVPEGFLFSLSSSDRRTVNNDKTFVNVSFPFSLLKCLFFRPWCLVDEWLWKKHRSARRSVFRKKRRTKWSVRRPMPVRHFPTLRMMDDVANAGENDRGACLFGLFFVAHRRQRHAGRNIPSDSLYCFISIIKHLFLREKHSLKSLVTIFQLTPSSAGSFNTFRRKSTDQP